MFCCRFEPDERVLKFANAGQNRPLLLRANDKTCAELDGDGLILGAKRNVDYEERRLSLSPGDRVLLYTDGVTEAQSPMVNFTAWRACARVLNHRNAAPEGIMSAVLQDVRAFCGPSPLSDDVAVVVLEVC